MGLGALGLALRFRFITRCAWVGGFRGLAFTFSGTAAYGIQYPSLRWVWNLHTLHTQLAAPEHNTKINDDIYKIEQVTNLCI